MNSLPTTGDTVTNVWEQVANGVSGMDRHAFTELMNGLWSGCGRTAKPDKTVLRVWYFCLHDLTEMQLANAIAIYLTQHSRDYLTVQLIRELSGVQQTKQETALTAWDEALTAIRLVGSYCSPAFTHATTSHVIESLGGWSWFGGQSPEELRNWVRARFLKTFDALEQSTQCRVPVRLKNLITEAGGAYSEMPVRIGYVAQKAIENR